MARKRKRHKKTYRHTYSQKRTDTKVVKTISVSQGDYEERKDGSVYPIPTTISVTKPTLDIYKILREIGKYDGHEEVVVYILEDFLKNITSHPKFSRLDEKTLGELKEKLSVAKINLQMKEKARLKADKKNRYVRRKTKVTKTR